MTNDTRFRVFFDGKCPLCRREIDWLRHRDVRQQVEFIDFTDVGFNAAAWGKTHRQLIDQIHGMTPQGCWVTGVEVFRHLYSAAGFGVLVSISRFPIVRPFLDFGYRMFARHRTRLTARWTGCNKYRCESFTHGPRTAN